jgi:hypothetical protein
MTLIELGVFCLRLFVSVGLGLSSGSAWGWPIGVPFGLIVFLAFPRVSAAVVEALAPIAKGKPICSNGVCDSSAYEWIEQRGSFPVCKCRCGIRYVHRGTSFDFLNEDGTTTPFRIWDSNCGWVPPRPDSTPQSPRG